ncbi:MAG: hypothetical protein ABI718_06830 [Acidobacteriota bacterium]
MMTRQTSTNLIRRTAGIAALTMLLSASAQAATFSTPRFDFGFGSFFSSIFNQFDSFFGRFGSGVIQLPPGVNNSGVIQLPPGFVSGSGVLQLPPG